MMQSVCVELVKLARHVANSPGEAAMLAAALRAALEIIQPSGCMGCRAAKMLEQVAGDLIMLADRTEWMAEQACGITRPPPA